MRNLAHFPSCGLLTHYMEGWRGKKALNIIAFYYVLGQDILIMNSLGHFNMTGQKEGDLAPQSSLVGINVEQKFDLSLVCVVVFNRLVQEGSLIAMGKCF